MLDKNWLYEPKSGHFGVNGWVADVPTNKPVGLYVWQALLITLMVMMIAVVAVIVIF